MRRVDVVVRTKDRPLFLARALQSIAAQTSDAWQCVVVNDGGEPGVVRGVVDAAGLGDRVEVLDHPTARGRWPSANAGIRHGSAELIVLHDDDDRWHPTFLERGLAELDARPDLPAALTRTEIVWERQVGDRFVEIGREPFEPGLVAPLLADLLQVNRFVPISLLYRRSVHAEIGEYREDLPVVGDWEFYLRLMRRWELRFLDGPPLAYWHQRPDARGSAGNSVIAAHTDHVLADALIRDRLLREHVAEHDLGELLYLTSFLERRTRRLEDAVGRVDVTTHVDRLEREVAEVRDRLDVLTGLLERAESRRPAARARSAVAGRLPSRVVRDLRSATRPHRLIVFPAWRGTPYLDLVHADARERGAHLVEVEHLEHLVDVLADDRRPPGVLHLHWTAPIVQPATGADDAQGRLGRFRSAVESFRAAGGRLVWTVHHRLPHECPHPEAERELVAFLAASADRVHVMSDHVASAIADVVELPARRTVVVPHPVPPAEASGRSAARLRRGLVDGERAVLMFGQLRPHQGLDVLVDALVDLARSDPAPTLLLAGESRIDVDVDASLRRLVDAGVRVVPVLGHVGPHEVGDCFAAADLVVAPDRDVLVSGPLHAAAAYDVPVLVPGLPHLRRELDGQDWVCFFDPERPASSLAAALAQETTWERRPGAARAFAAARRPADVARRTTELLQAVQPRILPRSGRRT